MLGFFEPMTKAVGYFTFGGCPLLWALIQGYLFHKVARAQGMPWVIVVKGSTVPGGRVLSQVAATASLDVRALESQSGAVVASAVKQTKGFGRTPEAAQQAAANEAGVLAGTDLAAALVAKENAGL